jgi:phosphatidylserine/phosphatidylglycerophosphate/cardiolipin synthase-like enzyme
MKAAVAFANNDVALVAWSYDAKIKNCLGFAVYRTDNVTGNKIPLPVWVGFKSESNLAWEPKDSTVWPIQKFNWRDLTASRGGSYSYEIVPMIGEPGNLAEDTGNRLVTRKVDLVPGTGNIRAYFNRGILSTQYLTHQVPQGSAGVPDYQVLKDRIDQPGDPLRNSLAGQMIEALKSLLARADQEGGECYCALYELNDPELLELLIGAKNVHIILSNTGPDDDVNVGARQALHESGVDIIDRKLKSGHIGHNKFVIYTDKAGKPKSVMTGSTNWTYTALCAQSNNAIIIDSPALAEYYLDYWNRMKAEPCSDFQCAEFRTTNKAGLSSVMVDGSDVRLWFSPNTPQKTKPQKNPGEPVDFSEVEDLILGAKKTVLFLLFQPGSPSVIRSAVQAQNNNAELFVRGAATDPDVVRDYNVDLFHRSAATPDTVVAASALDNQFAFWQKELLKSSPGAHAIIHDKTVVIDPLSDDCVVITGSHNLGFAASYANDENLLIIRGNRELAAMYGVHVMDIYDHYRWRYQIQKYKGKRDVFYNLDSDDSWQDKYFAHDNPAHNDLRVWFE